MKRFIVTRQQINIPNFIPRPSRSLRLFVIFVRYFTTMARNTVCALKRPSKPHEASLKMYTVALRLAELQLLGHMQTLSDIFGAPAPLLPINLLVNGVLKNIKLKTYVQEWNPLRADNCFTTDGVYEYFREVNNGFYGAAQAQFDLPHRLFALYSSSLAPILQVKIHMRQCPWKFYHFSFR